MPADTPGQAMSPARLCVGALPARQGAGRLLVAVRLQALADLPGRSSHRCGGTVYAIREAAEEYLYGWERIRNASGRDAGPS